MLITVKVFIDPFQADGELVIGDSRLGAEARLDAGRHEEDEKEVRGLHFKQTRRL